MVDPVVDRSFLVLLMSNQPFIHYKRNRIAKLSVHNTVVILFLWLYILLPQGKVENMKPRGLFVFVALC